ncbi:unnamed protein product [Clonostachys rhizophaga]|uniref:Cytidyltransferase-like domain-containing protein n=1 Tax=Clonostachys rhizophaga TaxID=160324 RepID=A0A9N9VR56_9HYPO|nr:unnamed protein product [Clonostachys rhizophaga]
MSAQNDTLSMSLGYYAELARYNGIAPIGTPNLPWNCRLAKDPPLVQKNGYTNILVFPGSFNPLHDGHFKLLDHVFKNSGFDPEFQAAIILNMDDEHVKRKLWSLPQTPSRLFLELKHRLDLSQEVVKHNGKYCDRYWVWDKDLNEFDVFIRDLRKKLVGHTTIELYALVGPDNLSVTKIPPRPETWCCNHLITSDIGRGVVDYVATNPIFMKQLPGCTRWEGTRSNIEKVRKVMEERMAGQDARDIQAKVSKVVEDTQSSVYCRLEGVPGRETKIVFIPHLPGPRRRGHAEAARDVSSTSIREEIAECMLRPSTHPSTNANKLRPYGVSSPIDIELARYVKKEVFKVI